ncbi:MAG: methionine adenosyltransferase, partial [Gemmatimonadota bacterium]|nr:methionine adenosyltransferase [Gemmatimonadota bacterium]
MSISRPYTFTSESVSEGHPDKVSDFVADSILDAHLAQDRYARVACEVLCKEDHLILAGEITSQAQVDHEAVARQAVREIGYTETDQPFHADTVRVISLLSAQAPEIAQGVQRLERSAIDQGAGDQGIMFGYATDETSERMPLPILLAHRLAASLAAHRRNGTPWLRPDAKTQVSVLYDESGPTEICDVLVSTQHAADVEQATIHAFVADELVPHTLGSWYHPGIRIKVNPTGSFVQGGPSADCGVTGRKIIVDT